MDDLGTEFRAYVLATNVPECSVEKLDEEHFVLTTPTVRGEVNFYAFEEEPEIVELRIVDPDCDCEPKFFLHFELTDEARAEELFDEMCSELANHDRYDTTRVLLCCTAGMTTSMFAAKLTEAASTLSLDYSFEAIPLAQAEAEGGDWDAVLLAPQVAYQRKAVTEAFPDAVVVQIPPRIFASFDAGAALKMVMHLLSDHTVFPSDDSNNLKMVRDLKNDYRIMVISMVKRPKSDWLGWRIYDRGDVVAQGHVYKHHSSYRDVEDLLSTLHLQGWNVHELDAVGIAVPGVVNRGTVSDADPRYTDYELGRSLSKRYQTKVFVDNNANAAAVGCYVTQTDYDSVVLHTQQTGFPVGGQGIVVDGHLLKGRKNFAGELAPLYGAIHAPDEGQRNRELAWSTEGMLQLVAPTLAADVSLVSPDAIFVAVDLLDDMDALRQAMLPFFHGNEEHIPDLVRVADYRERIAIGELALCLQKLNSPRPHRKH